MSSPASATGMAQTPRTASLPHPGGHQGSHISTREQYASNTPSYRRPSEHPIRSPPYPASAFRRHAHHISQSPTIPAGAFATTASRMESSQYSARPSSSTGSNIPPLEDMVTLGSLTYNDQSQTAAKVGVHGCIDKGFFQADGEWTCYRRNYFSCVCHYTISPYYPGVPVNFAPGPATSRGQPQTVQGFAMSITAAVADNDQHGIDLVQHTPKRDKGPTAAPPRVPLMAKTDPGSHHLGMYAGAAGMAHGPLSSPHYPDGWVSTEPSSNSPQTECTFERIQFKQATQNNGKRRAAQQYYHLIIELWANIGPPGKGQENWVKVAYRKSAKMIVRGRSPGHYQNERRGSSSNGPPGSAGSISGYHGLSTGGVSDFPNPMISAPYNNYNAQGSVYGSHAQRHHTTLPTEAVIPPEESKDIETTKGYQYYPAASLYENQTDQKIDMFSHQSESEAVPHQVSSSGVEIVSKEKAEYDHGPSSGSTSISSNTLPRLVHPPLLSSTDRHRRCGPFEGKSSSSGYYPHVMSPSTMSITMS